MLCFACAAAVCDPVMGDNGKLFLPAELVPLYQRTILPLAATVTPNAFEAEQLTGRPVTTEAEALAACDALHNMGPSTVVRCPDTMTSCWHQLCVVYVIIRPLPSL
jgi:pyridoxal/pyridoxine/pyridoxamine kinase